MSDPGNEIIELTPSASTYLTNMGKRAAILVPVIGFFGYRSISNSDSSGQTVGLIGLIVAVAVLSAGSMILHMRTSRIRLDGDRIVHTGALVRDKALPIAGLRGVLAPITQPMMPPTRTLVLQAPTQATTMATIRLVNSIWSDEDLQTMAAHARVGVEDQAISATAIEERFPDSMPVWMRRPWLVAVAATVLIVAGVAIIALAFM